MKRRMALTFHSILLLFVLTRVANAASDSPIDKFLGSPLLVLAAIIVLDIIAFIYHKIRK